MSLADKEFALEHGLTRIKSHTVPTGKQALLRNQRGPWLEITAGICFIIAVFARFEWVPIEYFHLFGQNFLKLGVYFIYLQIVLLCIRRQRKPRDFINLDITRYGKYPGPAPISFPVINGWRLAVLARLQNSLIGDFVITPFMMQAMGIKTIRRAVCSLQQTCYAYEQLPVEECKESSSNKCVVEPMPYTTPFTQEENWRPVTCGDYTKMYTEGMATPTDIAENIIENIRSVNPQINIICDFDEELIRDQALESSHRYRSGKPLGPLDGVPCVVKDQISVKGLKLRDGLPFQNQAAIDDAEIIRRLRHHGVVIIGMTNMVQLGLGAFGNNPSEYHGECRNPHDVQYYASGSSSGTAAAIACGLVPIGLGSDGGGSVRIPSATCDIVGLKPSCGRVSTTGTSIKGSNSVCGPMASNVADCALLYAAIAGPEKVCGYLQPEVRIPTELKPSLSGYRIGVDYCWAKQADPSIFNAFCESIDFLRDQGATVVDFRMPDLDYLNTSHLITFISEIGQVSLEHICNGKDIALDNYVFINAVLAGVKSSDYIIANKIRTKCMNQVRNMFHQFDFIATPTTGALPTRILPNDHVCGVVNITESLRHTLYSKIANFTGIPAISVPNGKVGELPMGIQLISTWWSEEKLFEIAAFLESNHVYKKPQVLVQNF